MALVCNPCTYYQGTKIAKIKTIEERQAEFKKLIWDKVREKDLLEEYPIWFLKRFCEHWNTVPDRGKKTLYEMEKKWNTLARLRTFKRNMIAWKQWKDPDQKKAFIGYYDRKYAAKLDPAEYLDYKIHLQELGFIFGGSANGQWVKPPNKERIWIY